MKKCKVCSKPKAAAASSVAFEVKPKEVKPKARARIDLSSLYYSPGIKPPPNHPQSSPKQPCSPPPPPPSKKKNVWQAVALARALKKKETLPNLLPNYLFMFFSFPPGSSIAYQLYAAKLPDGAQSTHKEPRPVEQVVAFPSQGFPLDMCCVQLDSKLYFLGGNRFLDCDVEWNEHPRQVYVLEPSIIVHKSSGRGMLKKGRPMNTGKPSPYALAAKGKIYIVSPIKSRCNSTRQEISRFEAFHPDSNVWEVLPEPPELGLVFGHAEVNEKILLSVGSGQVFYYDVGQRYWGVVYPDLPFLGAAHYVDGIFYAYAAPLCELAALTSSGTDTCGCNLEQYPPRFDPVFDCTANAQLPQSYSHFSSVIHDANELIHLGDHTFCCMKLYPDPEDYTVKIAAFHASHNIEQDFLADIFHVSEFSIQTSQGILPEYLCFVDACSVPLVQEEEYENEVDALFQSNVDINCETLWEISVGEDFGEDDDDDEEELINNNSDDDDEDVEALIVRSVNISKHYGIPTTP